ncbi:MAG: hypothetical protein H7144_12085 [Burkholderiales bacterium]|nr:hypothetical protein [Phycisphaerae bacterium]
MDKLRIAHVAITGVGLVTPLGTSAQSTWQRILHNDCGAGPMPAMESALPPGKDGGQAAELPGDFAPELPREARYLRWAIRDALKSAAALETLPCDPSRACYMLGTTLHGMRAAGRYLRNNNVKELHNFLAGDTLRLATAEFPVRGGSATTCSACSSSLGSIALGVTLLQSGAADLVIAGGYDAISEYAWAGFNALRLVSDPPLRPFTRGRVGMKLAEAYAIVVLERVSDAASRNADPVAIVAGWGESADAHHLTQPHPQGHGALAAMRQAIDRAGISAGDIGLVAAHATGTPDNDASEHAALAQLFIANPDTRTPVVGFKSHLGHTLGGAGACELILSSLALRDQVIPACANVTREGIEYPDLNVTHGSAQSGVISHTLNTSLGFGGANTSVVLCKAGDNNAQPATGMPAHDVVITGIGVLLPGISSRDSFVASLQEPPLAWQSRPRSIDDTQIEHLLNARRVRRLSGYVRISLAAATMACRDAALDGPIDAAAILGTMHGSAAYSSEYYGQIVREGVLAANPMLFAEGVPNAAAAQMSLMLGLKQACQTIIGTRTAGLDAIRLAMLRISTGQWTRAIVSAGEEIDQTLVHAYTQCGLHAKETGGRAMGSTGESTAESTGGFVTTSGAVALVIESADSALARGARIYARLAEARTASGQPDQLVDTIGRAIIPARMIVNSANATWIDRAERLGIRKACPQAQTSSVYDIAGELFSATPLVALAANVLRGESEFTVLGTDYSGVATSVRIEVGQ